MRGPVTNTDARVTLAYIILQIKTPTGSVCELHTPTAGARPTRHSTNDFHNQKSSASSTIRISETFKCRSAQLYCSLLHLFDKYESVWLESMRLSSSMRRRRPHLMPWMKILMGKYPTPSWGRVFGCWPGLRGYQKVFST